MMMIIIFIMVIIIIIIIIIIISSSSSSRWHNCNFVLHKTNTVTVAFIPRLQWPQWLHTTDPTSENPRASKSPAENRSARRAWHSYMSHAACLPARMPAHPHARAPARQLARSPARPRACSPARLRATPACHACVPRLRLACHAYHARRYHLLAQVRMEQSFAAD